MILLTFLYDEFIDGPQLSEQKKLSWVYSSSPPQVESEQKIAKVENSSESHILWQHKVLTLRITRV